MRYVTSHELDHFRHVNDFQAGCQSCALLSVVVVDNADDPIAGCALARVFVDRRCAQRSAASRNAKTLIPNIPADIVQDLYLKELKAFKPTPTVRLPMNQYTVYLTFVVAD